MNKLEQISQQTIQRYSDRYKDLGYNIRTLGWGTKEQQYYRFEQTLDSNLNYANQAIIDIGCGFGDYFNFLKEHDIKIKKYIGWDINPDLINHSKTIHNDNRTEFEVENVMEANKYNIADIGIMLGVLNFNLKDKMDNLEYSKKFIQKAFHLVNKVLIVDFLSSNLTPSYPKEDFVYYHNPVTMLEFAFTLSNNVVLKHNYSAIPQKEFMLFIYKD